VLSYFPIASVSNVLVTGAFVAAPIGGLLWGFGACALRIAALFVISKLRGHRFDALDRPVPVVTYEDAEHERVLDPTDDMKKSGRFF
jgi:hypothetical protein